MNNEINEYLMKLCESQLDNVRKQKRSVIDIINRSNGRNRDLWEDTLTEWTNDEINLEYALQELDIYKTQSEEFENEIR